jgi:hypothetical protein
MVEAAVIVGLALLLLWFARLILASGRAKSTAGTPVKPPFWRMMLLRGILVGGLLVLIALAPDSPAGSGRTSAQPVALSVAAWVAIAVIVVDALWDCLKPMRGQEAGKRRRKRG